MTINLTETHLLGAVFGAFLLLALAFSSGVAWAQRQAADALPSVAPAAVVATSLAPEPAPTQPSGRAASIEAHREAQRAHQDAITRLLQPSASADLSPILKG